MTASATSRVFALPPTSGGQHAVADGGRRSRRGCGRRARDGRGVRASSRRCQIVPIGLAMPWPAMSGAEPWTGSNMLGLRRSGSRLALAAIPRLPARALPRSDRISPKRFEATTTSSVSGAARSGQPSRRPDTGRSRRLENRRRTRSKQSSQSDHAVLLGVALGHAGDLAGAGGGELEGEANDPLAALFGEQGGLDGDLLARAAGCQIASADAGVLALGVFPHQDPVERRVAVERSGLVTLEKLTGRTLANWSKPWQMTSRKSPQADVVGHGGPADGAEVDRVEGELFEPVVGHDLPVSR